MKEILIVYPKGRGRFDGGITILMDYLLNNYSNDISDLNFNFINSSQTLRENKGKDKLSFVNLNNSLKLFFEIKSLIKSKKIDLIYFNSSANLALLKDLIILSFLPVKLIFHIHFSEFEKVFPKNKFLKFLCFKILEYRCSAIIVMNKQFKSELIKKANLKKPIVKHIYNFIPFSISNHIKKESSNTKKINFLFVGSIEERKGVIEIVKSFIKLNESFNRDKININLDIVGGFQSTDYENNLKNIISEKSNSINLNFNGVLNREQIRKMYLKSDVLIINSHSEGLPVVLLEALYYGLAIITTPVGAIPEILTNKKNCLFTSDYRNINDLKKNMQSLFEDKKLLLELKSQNKILSENFSFKSFLNNFYELTNKI